MTAEAFLETLDLFHLNWLHYSQGAKFIISLNRHVRSTQVSNG